MSFSTNSLARRVTIGTSLFSAEPADAGGGDHLLGLEVAERQDVREVPPPDLLGLLLGDLLDVDAADRREDHHRLLARPVPDDARVVLLLDLGLAGRRARRAACARRSRARGSRAACASACSGVSANLTPPAFIRPPVRTCDLITVGPPIRCAISRASRGVGREAVVGDGDAGALDDLARLVLEESHAARKPTRLRPARTRRPRPARGPCGRAFRRG